MKKRSRSGTGNIWMCIQITGTLFCVVRNGGKVINIIMATKWRVFTEWRQNYNHTLVFRIIIQKKILGKRRAREIPRRIYQRKNLWEQVQYAVLFVDDEAKGQAGDGRVAYWEDEEEILERKFHATALLENMIQAFQIYMAREADRRMLPD